MKKTVAIAGIMLMLSAWALADDLNPPAWRGDPGSTFQNWTFSAEPANYYDIAPEVVDNPYGDPAIIDSYGDNGLWYDSYEGRDGVWHAYWDFYIDLPNNPVANESKDIQIQFTYYYDDPNGWENGRPVLDDVIVMEGTYDFGVIEEYELGNNWYYSSWYVHIEPNPVFESLYFLADDDYSELIFDQIVVDTICVPEPASMALLAALGLLSLRRR